MRRARTHAVLAVLSFVILVAAPARALPPDAPRPSGADWPAGLPSPTCADCEVRPRFWAAAGELLAVQAIPSAYNIVVSDAEWARITPESWATNLENPWQWDNNKFLNNQFSHPYHGSLYFNAARSNGYDFWRSAPWAFAGSLMWELFGERWAPAPNDLWNTSLGGITLGETLWRASSLVLDNEATGTERVVREVGAGLINPVRGFTRLVDGHSWRSAANPPGFRPSRAYGLFDLGLSRTTGDTAGGTRESANAGLLAGELVYGDPVSDLAGDPFSTFDARLWLMSRQEEGGRRFARLESRGGLIALPLTGGGGERPEHLLAALITYDYFSMPALEFGGQGFALGPVSRWPRLGGFRLESELLATPMPIAAVRSDYFITEEGRDYDYGIGLGGRAELRASWNDVALLRGRARYLWQPVLSGYNGDHQQFVVDLESRVFVFGQIGLGAAASWYRRESQYDSFEDVTQLGRQLRVFVSLAGPRWVP